MRFQELFGPINPAMPEYIDTVDNYCMFFILKGNQGSYSFFVGEL